MKRITSRVALAAVVLAAGAVAGVVQAQEQGTELEAVRKDLETVKQDLAEIKKVLGEMRQLLDERPAPAAPAAPTVVKIGTGGGPALGKADAPVTLIEFSDYQCPFCQRHASGTLPALRQDYVDTGKIRYVFRDFPIESIHPQARKAAEAAHCASDQGKYWEMHDTLFRNQGALRPDSLKGYARDLGLDAEAFNACLDSGKYAGTVGEHVAAGTAVGVTGTPSFFVGKTTADGTIEATGIRGAQPLATFRQVLDRLLDAEAL